jgi:hypothetical protein
VGECGCWRRRYDVGSVRVTLPSNLVGWTFFFGICDGEGGEGRRRINIEIAYDWGRKSIFMYCTVVQVLVRRGSMGFKDRSHGLLEYH